MIETLKKEDFKNIWDKVSGLLSYEEKIELIPWCEKCVDGYVRVPSENGFWWKTKICWCLEEVKYLNKTLELILNSHLPRRWLDTFEPERYTEDVMTLDILNAFLQGFKWDRQRLYLAWTTWTGKTYTSFIILLMHLLREIHGLYVNVPMMLEKLRPWKEKDESIDWLQMCIEPEILVLDDLWQEKLSEWVLERIYIILNERYNECKKTVITSNYQIEEFAEKIRHRAIVSRVKHLCVPVDFTWKDKRLTYNAF